MVEQELSDVFHALSDPTRRGMLRALMDKDCTISELAAPYLMSFAAASKHVQVLERAGLLRRTISGRNHVCQVDRSRLIGACEWLGNMSAAAA